MLVGGFPELLTAVRDRPDDDESSRLLESQQVLRNDAVERAVYKDIPQSFGVDNPMMLERLLYVLAAQITGVLSPSNICSELGLSQPTFDRYLSYLERAFLVFTLPNFSGREATVQKRGRKLYFVDGAVRNAALQRGLAPLDNPVELGALLENLVAATLHSLSLHAGVRLHHWRDGKHEVDLVFDHPERPLAFEIGSSPDHSRAGLQKFMERHPRYQGRCYLVVPQVTVAHPGSTSSGVGTLPLDLFLLVVGSQAEQALARNLRVSA
jgi:predicted AAA+ superfamily ATPase